MSNEEVIARMRDRIARTRKVMSLAHHQEMIAALKQMIEEAEADIARLEAEDQPATPMPPPTEG